MRTIDGNELYNIEKLLDTEIIQKSPEQPNEWSAISRNNTRPAPPIGRCKDCKHQGTGDSDICHSGMDEEFCSGFEPRGEEAK